jgi:hypothetical protein
MLFVAAPWSQSSVDPAQAGYRGLVGRPQTFEGCQELFETQSHDGFLAAQRPSFASVANWAKLHDRRRKPNPEACVSLLSWYCRPRLNTVLTLVSGIRGEAKLEGMKV